MTTAVSCAELEIYALDALPPQEMDEFEAHLLTCDVCAKGLPDLHEAAALLALSAPLVRPPARLKMNILSLTAQEEGKTVIDALEERSKDKVTPLKTTLKRKAATAVIALGTLAASFTLGTTLASQYVDPSAPDASAGVPIVPTATILDDIKAAPDSAIINKKLSEGGEVSVAYSSSVNKAVFSSTKLAVLPADKVYQIWLQHRNGEMVPAGYTSARSDTLIVLEGDVDESVAMGITVEDIAGATTPTTNPLVLVNL